MKKLRIGILGGTFNPPHFGHLVLAQEALCQLKLNKVIFIPAFIPPHKKVEKDKPLMRYKMIALACKGNPAFRISTIELKRKAVSYSVDTLRAFKKRYGKKAELFFIIGSDSLSELKNWKNSRELLTLAHFVVAPRPQFSLRKNIKAIEMPLIDISSSGIRNRIRKSLSIRYLVPEDVRKFIEKNRLYK
ncbi:MAG: nicotinate-nucleotide adenylyltransferase [Candidatus Omnitrophica bacterium]|nr:nicotinate-nucleotide adenylyltransferase [Candidatus Omnitrophota bacterium]